MARLPKDSTLSVVVLLLSSILTFACGAKMALNSTVEAVQAPSGADKSLDKPALKDFTKNLEGLEASVESLQQSAAEVRDPKANRLYTKEAFQNGILEAAYEHQLKTARTLRSELATVVFQETPDAVARDAAGFSKLCVRVSKAELKLQSLNGKFHFTAPDDFQISQGESFDRFRFAIVIVQGRASQYSAQKHGHDLTKDEKSEIETIRNAYLNLVKGTENLPKSLPSKTVNRLKAQLAEIRKAMSF